VLTYTDNESLDPWAISQVLVEHTETLVPLVAVNPAEMHPLFVARMISTFGYMHERQLDLNLVTGGFNRHLSAIGCGLSHDERYDRLTEFGTIMVRLLAGKDPVTYQGSYYAVKNLTVTPPLPPSFAPRLFVSGSSDACLRLQAKLAAVRLSYPREISEYEAGSSLSGCGMRLGIIARETTEQAWQVARRRFPPYLIGEDLHDLAADQVESQWHRVLSRDALRSHEPNGCYWIYPFRSYRTFCPYFVGSHQEVADLLAQYISREVSAIILDNPVGWDDLNHSMIALLRAQEEAQRQQMVSLA
jgi:alkanesulfonate monooxygenase